MMTEIESERGEEPGLRSIMVANGRATLCLSGTGAMKRAHYFLLRVCSFMLSDRAIQVVNQANARS